MFRFFETLVDHYTAYEETNTPPRRLWPFIRTCSQPSKRVFAWAAVTSVVVAALYGTMQGNTAIDDRRIAETGDHDTLLAKGGLYARFWARQSGGFIDTKAAE